MTQIPLHVDSLNSNSSYLCICGVDQSLNTVFFNLINMKGDASVFHYGKREFEYLMEFSRFITLVKSDIKEIEQDLGIRIDFGGLNSVMGQLSAESKHLINKVMNSKGKPLSDGFSMQKSNRNGLRFRGGRTCYLPGLGSIECGNEFNNSHSISEANNLIPDDGAAKSVFFCRPKNGKFERTKVSTDLFSAGKNLCRNHDEFFWRIEANGKSIDPQSPLDVFLSRERTIAYTLFLLDRFQHIEQTYAREFRENSLVLMKGGRAVLKDCEGRALKGATEVRSMEIVRKTLTSPANRFGDGLVFTLPLSRCPLIFCNSFVFLKEGYVFLTVLRNGKAPFISLEFSSEEVLNRVLTPAIAIDPVKFRSLFVFLLINSNPFFLNTLNSGIFEQAAACLDFFIPYLNHYQISRTGISILEEKPILEGVRTHEFCNMFIGSGPGKTSTVFIPSDAVQDISILGTINTILSDQILLRFAEAAQERGIIPSQRELQNLVRLVYKLD